MSNPIKFIDNRKYHKTNYDKAVSYIIPKIYFDSDYELGLKDLDVTDKLINSHLNIIKNFNTICNVSSMEGTLFENINTQEGISQFFVKQNNLTDIDNNDFERRILVPLNKSYSDFRTKEEYAFFIENTLLPGITLNNPTLNFTESSPFSLSSNHEYLINNLSWLYFLNFSSPYTYQPSSYVLELLTEKTFNGDTITLNDGIKALTKYIWNNYSENSFWRNNRLIPVEFTPPQYLEYSDYTTSGGNQLEKLLTLIDVVYSPLYIDYGDFKVRDAIEDFLQNGYYLDDEEITGPFHKLIKAFSYSFADYSNNVDRLELLTDISKCPDEYLPYIAELIGWDLLGSEPDRWRLQLVNAVNIYRTTGTKKSIQFAVDSVLGQEVFDVESKVQELWESYIPNLIQYAFVTECSAIKDKKTFLPDECIHFFGFQSYSVSSFEDNIKSIVDNIIFETIQRFPDNFIFNKEKFPIDFSSLVSSVYDPNYRTANSSSTFYFNYRNKIGFPIPPFEEIPYYSHVRVTPQMIDFIVDKMVCLGVRETFAIQVGNYIKSKIYNSDILSVDNGFLMFMSGIEYPPNWEALVKDITNSKLEYAPLWCGKSSHFKIILEASGFDFSKTSLEGDSRETISIAAEAARQFSPAHAIPDIAAVVNDIDDYNTSALHWPYVGHDYPDTPEEIQVSDSGLSRYGASAILMGSYKRGLTATSVNTFSRGNADELNDPLIAHYATPASLPRVSHRRRDFKNILVKEGCYLRTGSNQPVAWENYTRVPAVTGTDPNSLLTQKISRDLQISAQPVVYLGLIPSSNSWVSIPDYNNIPAIYDICENLNSNRTYSGLIVSNTYPVRGWKSLDSNLKIPNPLGKPDKYIDRNQLNIFLATLHYINEQKKLVEASAYFLEGGNITSYIKNKYWQNVIQSRVNTLTEVSGQFPNKFDDYYSFQFGREFHKFYYDYSHLFADHRLSPNILFLDGPTIFAHAFGRLLANQNFKTYGSLISFLPDAVTTDLKNFKSLNCGEGVFSLQGVLLSGTTLIQQSLNSPSSNEMVASGIIKHVEFVQTSGSSPDNSFAIIRLSGVGKNPYVWNKLLYENVLIKQTTVDGFGRLILDISKEQTDASLYEKPYNFLTPNHEFKMKLKTLVSSKDGRSLGGGTIGVWIHTRPENGKIWSFKDKWIQHDQNIPRSQIIYNYSNLFTTEQRTRPPEEVIRNSFACLSFINSNNENRFNDVIGSFTESDFAEHEVIFDTINKPNEVPFEYQSKISTDIHRLDQKYVIEIFTIPEPNDKFTLYHGLSMQDLTYRKMCMPLILRTSKCKEYRLDIEESKLLQVIKYFNMIRGKVDRLGYASRSATETSGVYGQHGGSRINYVESPDWNVNTKNTLSTIEDITIIN